MNELWECRDCFFTGPLTMHGRCCRCNSEVVISQEVLVARVLENDRKRQEATSEERVANGWKTRRSKSVTIIAGGSGEMR